MKRAALSIVALAILLTISAGTATAEEAQTLTGEFIWSHRSTTGDLEAIFTPKGEGKWDVAFHFEFRGKPHVYSGTAEGSLKGGELKGTVLNESKHRTFTFTGTVTEGQFSGTHAEIGDDGAMETGTLTLGS
jgi:hypothetical protein